MGCSFPAKVDQNGEGADIHEGVCEQIEHDSRYGPVGLSAYTGDKTDKDVSHMGDGGVGKHPLEVGLSQGRQVPHCHGKHSEHRDQDLPLVPQLRHGLNQYPNESRKTGRLGSCRHKGCHRGGRSLVNVRGPLVERYHGDLETEPNQDHEQPNQQSFVRQCSRMGPKGLSDDLEMGAAGDAVNIGHTEKQNTCGNGTQDKILKGCFVGKSILAEEAGQDVQRHGKQL